MSDAQGDSPFPTFFMSGFECSTFVWKDRKRRDYVALTAHDRRLREDYERLARLGIGVVREGVLWPFVDKGAGGYDWSLLDRALDAARSRNLTVIWDLCHFGFPDGCDPFTDDCRARFVAYCRAAAERIAARTAPPRFFTPVNEITFFSGAGTDQGWMYPFAKGRYQELKTALCRMAIDAVRAIREIDPAARMVHMDPLIHAVAPQDRPDLAEGARHHAYEQAYEAWDTLAGRLHPELGGSIEVLDIVGANVFPFSQAQMNADGSREVLAPEDPRRRRLSELLEYAWRRYRRPMIIGETAGHHDERASWLRGTVEECLEATRRGVELHGVCLYPCVDIPEWQSGKLARIGLFDIDRCDEDCRRIPCEPYIDELRRLQRVLGERERAAAPARG